MTTPVNLNCKISETYSAVVWAPFFNLVQHNQTLVYPSHLSIIALMFVWPTRTNIIVHAANSFLLPFLYSIAILFLIFLPTKVLFINCIYSGERLWTNNDLCRYFHLYLYHGHYMTIKTLPITVWWLIYYNWEFEIFIKVIILYSKSFI